MLGSASLYQELERERFAAKCTMLQKKNSEMSKKISELEEVIVVSINSSLTLVKM